jgi:hypothetical protein
MKTYEILREDTDCCAALGRIMLAGAQLETNLRVFLTLNGVKIKATSTLGGLVQKLREHALLSDNGYNIMLNLKLQRNYLTHSLYDLFAKQIDEHLMSREELADVGLLEERASLLEQNLNGLTKIVEMRIAELQGGGPIGELLFRP